jgi:hypothetical protein
MSKGPQPFDLLSGFACSPCSRRLWLRVFRELPCGGRIREPNETSGRPKPGRRRFLIVVADPRDDRALLCSSHQGMASRYGARASSS